MQKGISKERTQNSECRSRLDKELEAIFSVDLTGRKV
jgi:hypothetical protein